MQNIDSRQQMNDTVTSAKSAQQKYHSKIVDISFTNIKYTVTDNKGKQRDILCDLDGFCPDGEVTAILGASGAGKTSLLNILACRVLANSVEYTADVFSSFAGYVMQNDVLFETFTPREAFQFVANLKYVHNDEKHYHVEHAIKSMKLHNCQNTFIGGITFKGISGGERKRTSIGFELVSNPSCILLDEPTSGLDSFTAFQIINELKNLAHNQERTVIFTIHQPSSDIYLLFDRVMLLVLGKFIYQGPREELVNYFGNLGFPCPKTSNPMDFMMGVMHTQKQVNIDNFPLFFNSYAQMQHPEVLKAISESEKQEIEYKKVETSVAYQISLITHRAFQSLKRDKVMVRQRFGQAVFLGLLIGGSFWGIGKNKGTFSDYSGVAGCLFLLVMNLTMGSLFPVVLQFNTERDVFLREENSKLYSTFSYFVGKSCVDVPFCFFAPIIQELILYWMVDLNYDDAGVVFIHLFVSVICSLNGNSIGLMVGCAFNDIKSATGIAPMFLLPLAIFAGFFANSKQFYVWIGWIKYISPMKYAFEALATNEFTGRPYSFGDPIDVLGFDIGLWQCVGILIALAIAVRVMGYFFLQILRQKQQ